MDLQLPMQLVPIPLVSSNPAHGEVYSIQYYVIKFVIAPYIRMLDSDWLIAVIFFTNSGLTL
jgi:hypothetical protein